MKLKNSISALFAILLMIAVVEDLKCDTLGNIYLTGYFRSGSIIFGKEVAENNWHPDLLDSEYHCNPDGKKDDCRLAKLKAFFIIKISQNNGAIQWVKSDDGEHIVPYENPACAQRGSISELEIGATGTHLAIDSIGNIYASFTYLGSSVQFGNIILPIAEEEAATGIVKYAANGNVLWAKQTPAGPISFDNTNKALVTAYIVN